MDTLSKLRIQAEEENDRVLYREIFPARLLGADSSALDLLLQKSKRLEIKIEMYDRAETILWPINSGLPRDSVEAERHAMVSIRSFESHALIENQFEIVAATFFTSAISIPPGATIRSTPRRPGAPSAALPH